MLNPKMYIAKATRNSSGKFTVGSEVEIQEHFKGVRYNKADGAESYGKVRSYTET